MLAFLLSVPLPISSQFLRDNPVFAWMVTLVALVWIGSVVAVLIGLHASRLRHWVHRHLTADGRAMGRRLAGHAR